MSLARKLIILFQQIYAKNLLEKKNKYFLEFILKSLFIYINFIFLFYALEIHIIITIIITFYNYKFFWKVFTTWYYIDRKLFKILEYEWNFTANKYYIFLASFIDLLFELYNQINFLQKNISNFIDTIRKEFKFTKNYFLTTYKNIYKFLKKELIYICKRLISTTNLLRSILFMFNSNIKKLVSLIVNKPNHNIKTNSIYFKKLFYLKITENQLAESILLYQLWINQYEKKFFYEKGKFINQFKIIQNIYIGTKFFENNWTWKQNPLKYFNVWFSINLKSHYIKYKIFYINILKTIYITLKYLVYIYIENLNLNKLIIIIYNKLYIKPLYIYIYIYYNKLTSLLVFRYIYIYINKIISIKTPIIKNKNYYNSKHIHIYIQNLFLITNFKKIKLIIKKKIEQITIKIHSLLYILNSIGILMGKLYKNKNIYILYIKIFIKNNTIMLKKIKFKLKLIMLFLFDKNDLILFLKKDFYNLSLKKYIKNTKSPKKIPDYLKRAIKISYDIFIKYFNKKLILYQQKFKKIYNFFLLFYINKKTLPNFNLFPSNLIIINLNLFCNKIILKFLIKHVENLETNFVFLNLFKLYNIYIISLKLPHCIKLDALSSTTFLRFIKILYLLKIYMNFFIKIVVKINKIVSIVKDNMQFSQYYLTETYKNCTKKLNKQQYFIILYILYLPTFLLNFFFSDIALSLTLIKHLYWKVLKFIIIKIKKILYMSYYLLYLISTIIKPIIDFFHRKTIYLVFILSYIYNTDSTKFFLNFYLDQKISTKNQIISIVALDKNLLYVIIPFAGILITLSWAKKVHSLFGHYLWTLTVFPFFLESHKTLYIKLISISLFDLKNINYFLILKSGWIHLYLFEYYQYGGTFILIWVFLYSIKHQGFAYIYANILAPRWFFIKYPLFILLIEIYRIKIVKIISSYFVYWNLIENYNTTIVNTFYNLLNNYYIKITSCYFNDYIWEIKIPYFILLKINFINLYLINFFIDFIVFLIALIWVRNYCKTYVISDEKFVAFPLVAWETITKYVIYIYILYFGYIYSYIYIKNGLLLWYTPQFAILWWFYLDFRNFKIPKKTMAWYFKQMVEFWPSAIFSLWTQQMKLYCDRFRFLPMKGKFRRHAEQYREIFGKREKWEKTLARKFQRDKEEVLHLIAAFWRLLYRNECMMREFNDIDYMGWNMDWTYNYKNFTFYHWKLDWWHKPYFYLYVKLGYLTFMRDFHMGIYPSIYRFSAKFSLNTLNFQFVRYIDSFYTNFCIYDEEGYEDLNEVWGEESEFPYEKLDLKHGIFYRGRKYRNICQEWKIKTTEKDEQLEYLRQMKSFKEYCLENNLKDGEIIIPLSFLREYRKRGWAMFDNKEADAIELDWRPDFEEFWESYHDI